MDQSNAPQKGRGHVATVKLPDGQEKQIPWGFKNPKLEGKAAKAVGIEYPGTARKE